MNVNGGTKHDHKRCDDGARLYMPGVALPGRPPSAIAVPVPRPCALNSRTRHDDRLLRLIIEAQTYSASLALISLRRSLNLTMSLPTENVVIVDDDVAHIDADAELDPLVLGYLGVYESPPVSFQRGERAFLVGTHQPTVTSDIGRQDGCEPAFYALRGQREPPAY